MHWHEAASAPATRSGPELGRAVNVTNTSFHSPLSRAQTSVTLLWVVFSPCDSLCRRSPRRWCRSRESSSSVRSSCPPGSVGRIILSSWPRSIDPWSGWTARSRSRHARHRGRVACYLTMPIGFLCGHNGLDVCRAVYHLGKHRVTNKSENKHRDRSTGCAKVAHMSPAR